MAVRPGIPNRAPTGQASKAHAAPMAEAQKIDPSVFQQTPQSMKVDLPPDAILLGAPTPPRAAPPPPPVADLPMPPPEPQEAAAEDPMRRAVSDDLVGRLAAKLGLAPAMPLHEGTVAIGDGLQVSYRPIRYEDYLWSLSAYEARVSSGRDVSLVSGDAQRELYLSHIVACRRVVKIDGQWVWDILDMSQEIEHACDQQFKPWSGTSIEQVPDFLQGKIAHKVYDVFRSLSPDALFILSDFMSEKKKETTPPNPKTAT